MLKPSQCHISMETGHANRIYWSYTYVINYFSYQCRRPSSSQLNSKKKLSLPFRKIEIKYYNTK